MSAAPGHPGTGSELRTGDGVRVVLGRLIKAGGAGAVYRVAGDADAVAKVYHAGQDLQDYGHRIAAMLALRPELPDLVDAGGRHVQIAWPRAALHAAGGAFVGFLMPAVDVDATAELEMVLQERQARAHGLPTGLGAKVTLAANLAAVIAALHRQGHAVVDMKPVNLRFYPRSLYMAMLDCDGFGIRGEARRFAAPQFTPDYLAPEFHRGGLDAAGEEAQDRFALAVIVFQLLNFGLHPYSGRPLSERVATDIPARIAQHAYAYGLRAHSDIRPAATSGHAALPLPLRALFDRAFAGAGTRPSAAEWADALRGYAERARGAVVACAKVPAHQHFAGLDCAACARAALIADAARRAGEAQAQSAGRVAAALGPPRWRAASPSLATPPAKPPLRTTPGGVPGAVPRGTPPPVRSGGRSGIVFPPVGKRGGGIGQVAHIVLWLAIFGVFMALRSCSDDAAERYRSPPSRARPAVQVDPAAGAQDRVVAPFLRAEAQQAVRSVIDAAAAGDTAGINAGLRALRGGMSPAASAVDGLADDPARLRPPPPPPAADGTPPASPAQQEVARNAWYDRNDPHLAFEAGWRALREDRAHEAEAWFVQAIAIAPQKPGPWLGLALVPHADDYRIGALTMAESLVAPARAEAMRAQAQAELAGLRIDPGRWALLSARARRLHSQRNGTPLPEAIRLLAETPLP